MEGWVGEVEAGRGVVDKVPCLRFCGGISVMYESFYVELGLIRWE